jgi:hypothetical protein
MKHLDITIDFETCSMTANAAVMQVAMVPWLRDNDADPFSFDDMDIYEGCVDLRTCVVDGFDFDPETIKWWSERNLKAKEAVTKGEPKAVDDVLIGMLNYIRELKEKHALTSIFVWCQGMDFDIAILRNLCRKYGVKLEEDIPHTSFRDCRTVILEAALIEASRSLNGKSTRANGIILPEQILAGSYDVYKMFDPLPERYSAGSEAHDALYDALRSSWNTWQALKWLNA